MHITWFSPRSSFVLYTDRNVSFLNMVIKWEYISYFTLSWFFIPLQCLICNNLCWIFRLNFELFHLVANFSVCFCCSICVICVMLPASLLLLAVILIERYSGYSVHGPCKITITFQRIISSLKRECKFSEQIIEYAWNLYLMYVYFRYGLSSLYRAAARDEFQVFKSGLHMLQKQVTTGIPIP